jgi:hypothetical protein
MVTVTFSHQGAIDSKLSLELAVDAAAVTAVADEASRARAVIARNTSHSFVPAAPTARLLSPPVRPNA